MTYAARYEAARCLWRAGDVRRRRRSGSSNSTPRPRLPAGCRRSTAISGPCSNRRSSGEDDARTRRSPRREKAARRCAGPGPARLAARRQALADDLRRRRSHSSRTMREGRSCARRRSITLGDRPGRRGESSSTMLKEPATRKRAEFWRLGATLRRASRSFGPGVECREKALALEFRDLAEVFDAEAVDARLPDVASTLCRPRGVDADARDAAAARLRDEGGPGGGSLASLNPTSRRRRRRRRPIRLRRRQGPRLGLRDDAAGPQPARLGGVVEPGEVAGGQRRGPAGGLRLRRRLRRGADRSADPLGPGGQPAPPRPRLRPPTRWCAASPRAPGSRASRGWRTRRRRERDLSRGGELPACRFRQGSWVTIPSRPSSWAGS